MLNKMGFFAKRGRLRCTKGNLTAFSCTRIDVFFDTPTLNRMFPHVAAARRSMSLARSQKVRIDDL